MWSDVRREARYRTINLDPFSFLILFLFFTIIASHRPSSFRASYETVIYCLYCHCHRSSAFLSAYWAHIMHCNTVTVLRCHRTEMKQYQAKENAAFVSLRTYFGWECMRILKWTSHMRLSNVHMSFSNLIYGNTTTLDPIVFIHLFDIFPCV